MTAGYCLECGRPARRRTCSTRCSRARSARARRAQVAATRRDPIVPLVVFDRDRWRCCLCGAPTSQRAVAPHPDAPVVDHVVPLSRGGEDTYRNVQTAHYRCNAVKGDGYWPTGEQLRLVG